MNKNLINSNDIRRWKSVPLYATREVANACCSGLDYMRCSKTDILESFAYDESPSYEAAPMNIPRFKAAMDELASYFRGQMAKDRDRVQLALLNNRP